MIKHISIIIVGFALCFSAISADLDFYGNMGLGTWITKREYVKDDTVINGITGDTAILEGDSLPQQYTDAQLFGKFGARLLMDKFGFFMEMGVGKGITDYASFHATGNILPKIEGMYMTMRKWYGEFYISDFISILAGQTYSPANFLFSSNQAFFGGNSFLNTGCLYTGRNPMLQFSIGNTSSESSFQYEFKVAGIKVDTSALKIRDDTYPMMNTTMPKIEGSAGFTVENDLISLRTNIAGGFVKYTYYATKDPLVVYSMDADAAIFGIDFAARVGPVTLTLNGNTGKNWGIYGSYWDTQFLKVPSGKTQNRELYLIFFPKADMQDSLDEYIEMQNGYAAAGCVILRGEFGDWFSIESGYGIVRAWHDYKKNFSPYPQEVPYQKAWHNVRAFYVNMSFEILEHFLIVPEFGLYDYGPELWYGNLIYGGFNVGFSF